MTGIGFASDTITVVRATAVTDRYGDTITDWDTATTTELARCRIQPATGPEDTIDRDQITRRWLLFAPSDADIAATDRIRWQGVDYDIDGELRRWSSPTGRLAHLEADLVRVEG